MNTDHRYQLESQKLTGRRQQKTTCPSCGRRRCFVRYVDTHNGFCYLHDSVGRCDHEHSCGYHYRPAEFFHDHPQATDCKPVNITPPTPPPPKPLQPLPLALVTKSHTPISTFWQWYETVCIQQLNVNPDIIQRIYEDYHVGSTRQGDIIFWQIDEQQQVRTGHIMRYGNDGHRKDYQGWVHSRLINEGLLPSDWQLYQCFYGQHLLRQYPYAHVCIVESEKTALIMAARHPDMVWLATCGSSGLNPRKVECLRTHRFTLFPDSGCFRKWLSVMQKTSGLQYTISELLEQYPANTDLADLLLQPPLKYRTPDLESVPER